MLRFHSTFANKFRRQVFCLLAVAASSAAYASEPSGDNWHRDWDSALAASEAEGRPILFFVTMGDGCYYCEKMVRSTYSDPQVLDEINRDFVLASIDSNQYPKIAKKLKVQLFPTTVIVGLDGKVIDSKRGYAGPDQLRSWLKTAATKNSTPAIASR
jgi:thioredoxin-related protein